MIGAVRQGVEGWWVRRREALVDRWQVARAVGRVAINRRPVAGPWGGGNQWLSQTVRHLRASGWSVRFDLRRPVDAIVLADPRPSPTAGFGVAEIRRYLAAHPAAACLHRINENDLRKGTTGMDRLLAEANGVADFTVFISSWLRDYHAQRWFALSRPHAVILNGADPAVFHPRGSGDWSPDEPMRLVTHHWSDHWRKGFDVYQELDGLIAAGRLPGTELWVIGRWPAAIRWRAARLIGPSHGARLAGLLRRCHVYVTASRAEPGGMHAAEGAQCGLPLLYHAQGGGIVELADGIGLAFSDDVRGGVLAMRERYARVRAAVLARPPSGRLMAEAYRRAIEAMANVASGGGAGPETALADASPSCAAPHDPDAGHAPAASG